MAEHIIAKAMTGAADQAASLRDKIEEGFAALRTAIANGDRVVQEETLAALHGLVHTSQNLTGAMHQFGESLLPAHLKAADAAKGEAQSVEDAAAARGRKR